MQIRSMTKRVSIDAPIPIRTLKPVIYGYVPEEILSTGDILKCLCKRAKVYELLPDGTKVKLTYSNYYLDNGAGLDARKTNPIQAKTEVAPEPVATPTPNSVSLANAQPSMMEGPSIDEASYALPDDGSMTPETLADAAIALHKKAIQEEADEAAAKIAAEEEAMITPAPEATTDAEPAADTEVVKKTTTKKKKKTSSTTKNKEEG